MALNKINKQMIDDSFVQDVENVKNSASDLTVKLADMGTKKADVTYVDTKAASIASGSPKGTYSTVTALQAAFPTGNTNIYLVVGNVKEVASLTISATPTAAGNITVTLNGVATNIAVDPAVETSPVAVATKIRNTVFSGWTTGGSGSIVTFTANAGGVKTDSTYSAGTTGSTGAMTTTTQGVDADGKWYYWNGSAWTAGGLYQSSGIDKRSITKDKVDFLTANPTANLFDKEKARLGGYYDGSGNWLGNPNYATSDFIPVEINAKYTTQAGGYVCFWDSNKVFISSVSGGGTKTVPNNANIKYATFPVTLAIIDTTIIVKGDVLPSTYMPPYEYSISDDVRIKRVDSKIKGLTWVAGGDSITAWNPTSNYVAQINSSHGTVGLNYGLGGRAIASRPSLDVDYPPMVTAYTTFPKNADIVTIWCGANDFGSQVPLGTINGTDITTFYGALNVLATGLIGRHLGKKIALITPMQRAATGDDSKAIPLSTYVQAIKDIGFKYGIPVFDMYNNCGLYPKISAVNEAYFANFGNPADGLHPNPEGHKIFAPRIATFLESL